MLSWDFGVPQRARGDLVPASHTNDTVERAALIHREIFQLSVLILVAIGAFLLTRAVAASNREMSLRDAAEWYRHGQQAINAGRVDDAIDSLRRATVKDRSDKRYVLALARALALKQDNDAARSVLITLRESAPEDPDINLQLARLAAARSDVTEALRFYHNALYAPWSTEQADARRGVRLELIRFLLTHDQNSRAISELLALSTDLPDDTPLRLEVAQLFAKAGDNGHALDQFQRALRLAPENSEALAGAGQAAFRLGDYMLARTYLRGAPEADDVKNTREVVDLVLSNDPLANRLKSTERRRRLVADFSYAQQRLGMCLEERGGGQPTGDAPALQREAHLFEDQLKPPAILEQDTVESGVDLIDRIERLVVQRCGPPTALDQALVLIGHQHGS
jgi:Flp pilus assembly protein TadD